METPQRNLQDEHPAKLRELMDNTLEFGTTTDLEALFDDGMDINQTDHQDRTALMMSAARGKKDAVEMLLKRGADVNIVMKYQGRLPKTALDAATENGKTEIANILLAHGAKKGSELPQS